MKKLLIVCGLVLLGMQNASAQKVEDYGIFEHVGANLSVGTEGISIGVATPITNYLEVGMGVNFMVAIKPSGDVQIKNVTLPDGSTRDLGKLNIKGNLARTTWDFKVSAYPFGTKNDLFVAAGFSFGGKKIATLEGHNDEVVKIYNQYPEMKGQISAVIDQYDIHFDDNGNVDGDLRVNAFRPYLGLGYGRLVPRGRVGFRAELGLQFMGHIKVYQNDSKLDIDQFTKKEEDSLSKWVNKLAVYPVLKFMLTTRIL